ncbi:hypothetical protein ACFFWB_26885 [Flavobacterium procerum]|uniref:hypothetical protein n=1 Tax=Flavobacterium procerum TaxID=1455569 RepID=UPI0035E4A6ED
MKGGYQKRYSIFRPPRALGKNKKSGFFLVVVPFPKTPKWLWLKPSKKNPPKITTSKKSGTKKSGPQFFLVKGFLKTGPPPLKGKVPPFKKNFFHRPPQIFFKFIFKKKWWVLGLPKHYDLKPFLKKKKLGVLRFKMAKKKKRENKNKKN